MEVANVHDIIHYFLLHSFYSIGKVMDVHIRYFTLFISLSYKLNQSQTSEYTFLSFYFSNYLINLLI